VLINAAAVCPKPQQQRLQQCALVCKAWASAAALATIHIQQTFPAEGHSIPALERWLQQHARQLESLQLTHSSRSPESLDEFTDEELSLRVWNTKHSLQLPWAKLSKLQHLQLDRFKLTLPGEGDSSSISLGAGASSSSSSSSSSCGQDTYYPAPLLLPRLQQLQLSKVELVSSSSLLQLAGVPGLTSLKLLDNSFSRLQDCNEAVLTSIIKEPALQQLAASITRLLQQLPRLVVLELPGFPMSAAAMQQLSCMQGLQQVTLDQPSDMAVCNLQHLPRSITQLQVKGCFQPGVPKEPTKPPQLQQLAGLLRLELLFCAVPPKVLGAFTRLQALKLFVCTLLPAPPEPDDSDDLLGYEAEGTAALLNVLAGMTCLQDLELSCERLDTVSTAPQRFAALTASTQLTRLAINPLDHIPLADGAAQYMFPAGRQLPLLRELNISPEVTDGEWAEEAWCMEGADICSIAQCCTGLQKLYIGHSVRPGAGFLAKNSSVPALLAQRCLGSGGGC
jgi:hypothetical protein